MSGLIDKFGLYLQHFETIISDTTKKTDKATFKGKRKQLTDVSILLCSALFIELLEPTEKFSILSQREDFNIIDIVDCLDDMLLSYQIRKRDIDNDPDTRKWILPESMAISEANLTCLFEKNIEALKCVFLHFEDILVKTFPGVNVLSIEEEFILVVSHAIKHFNTQIHPPLALWHYIYGIRESKSWLNIFGMIEICMCTLCANATLERFFSQLHVVKSVWSNCLSEENSMHLLRIKVTSPSLEILCND